jgi:hypothetical protein
VAWWLSQRKAAETGDEPSTEGKTFEDPELAERTRRIREEIQRKIEQRARGYPTEQPTRPQDEPVPRVDPELAGLPPILRELVEVNQPEPAKPTRAATSRLEAQRMAEMLEQQATLEEQLKQAQEMKAAALRRTQFETEVASKEEQAKVAVLGALGDDLRDPAALRRAIILREILGPPVALR